MLGATFSILIKGLIFGYFIFRLVWMVWRMDPLFTMSSLRIGPDEDDLFKPQESGFNFAFGLQSPLDPKIGYFTANLITN